MKKLLFVFLLLTGSIVLASEAHYSYSNSTDRFANSLSLKVNQKKIATGLADEYLSNNPDLTNFELRAYKVSDDGTGTAHVKYHFFKNEIRIYGASLIVHVDMNNDNVNVEFTEKAPKYKIEEFPQVKMNCIEQHEAIYNAQDYLITLALEKRKSEKKLQENVLNDCELSLLSIERDVVINKEKAELIYYPEVLTKRYKLVWDVEIVRENIETSEIMEREILLDAFSGNVINTYNKIAKYSKNNIQKGVGQTLYLGEVDLYTAYDYKKRSYTLTDMYHLGSFILDANNGNGFITYYQAKDAQFFKKYNVWGDFCKENRETDAASLSYLIGKYMEFLNDRFERHGVKGDGEPMRGKVHYGHKMSINPLNWGMWLNAFYSATTHTIYFGDGFKSDEIVQYLSENDSINNGALFDNMITVDVVGHELGHGIFADEIKDYGNKFSEDMGVNEGNSDVMGTLFEFWLNHPNDKPDWLLGEKCYITLADEGMFLRDMKSPKLDGFSIDHYSLYVPEYDKDGIENEHPTDCHYSCGIVNNFFYLLVNGGENDTSHMRVENGVGIDKAAKIWYSALVGYLVNNPQFIDMRIATEAAAVKNFGPNSEELEVVKKAWDAVGVIY